MKQNEKNKNFNNCERILTIISITCYVLSFLLLFYFFYTKLQDSRGDFQDRWTSNKIEQGYRELRYEGTRVSGEENQCYTDYNRSYYEETRIDGYTDELISEDIRAGSERIYGHTGGKGLELVLTSYNPEVYQTDDSPEIGAIGINLVYAVSQGIKPLALSQDLIYGSKGHYCRERDLCFAKYGDHIKIESDNPLCNGEYVVLDTMNKKFTLKGDIFRLNKQDNINCKGIIYNLNQ